MNKCTRLDLLGKCPFCHKGLNGEIINMACRAVPCVWAYERWKQEQEKTSDIIHVCHELDCKNNYSGLCGQGVIVIDKGGTCKHYEVPGR